MALGFLVVAFAIWQLDVNLVDPWGPAKSGVLSSVSQLCEVGARREGHAEVGSFTEDMSRPVGFRRSALRGSVRALPFWALGEARGRRDAGLIPVMIEVLVPPLVEVILLLLA